MHLAGWSALVLSAASAVAAAGRSIGMVERFGALSISALLRVSLLSYRPPSQGAVTLALAALAAWR